jgi:hypothetical protein
MSSTAGGTLQDDFLRVWSENLAYLVGTNRILIFPTEVRFPLDFRITADMLTFGTPAGGARPCSRCAGPCWTPA